ncbi:hypothetical protein [Streptomyces griseoluteus]|uniref:hypothetical protein n=1 Tax=Streptomyces griseoluteus TaxID=29306 RepID=UPI0038151FF2
MDAWVPYLVLCGGLAVVLGALTRLALHVRRRGGAGGALAAYEEAFRATGHAAYQEIRAEAGRRTPADSPDGPFRRTR